MLAERLKLTGGGPRRFGAGPGVDGKVTARWNFPRAVGFARLASRPTASIANSRDQHDTSHRSPSDHERDGFHGCLSLVFVETSFPEGNSVVAASLPGGVGKFSWLPGHDSHMHLRFDSLALALRVGLRPIHLRCASSETVVLLLDDPAMAEG